MKTIRILSLFAAVAAFGAMQTFDGVTSRALAASTQNSLAEASCIARAQQRGGGTGLRAMTHSTSDKGLVTISIKGVGTNMWTCIAHEDGTISFLSRDSAGRR